eukprot:NODE_553_length_2111_cov_24.285160_g510_i0.p1 GENE.NODE_553_length_2111_cov_24.285160_g510_i0~~NODE_553_length_2111_cov_24.285160_g510_i0.p1  ORF type:complete len:344 (+),score=61.07 NODE_553_length_2111_cov_24.285160_g510_i0:520-1551(+)
MSSIAPSHLQQVDSSLKERVDMLVGILPRQPPVCDRCEVQSAELGCDQCSIALCAPCNQAHHIGKVLRSHTVVSLSENKVKDLPFCTVSGHEHHRCDLLCTVDGALLCKMCFHLEGEHAKHQCVTIPQAIRSMKQEINQWLQRTEAQKLELKCLSDFADATCLSMAKRTGEEVLKVKEYFAHLREMIDKKEDELLQEALGRKEEQVEKLSKVKWQVFERACAFNAALASAQDALRNGGFHELQRIARNLHEGNATVIIPPLTSVSLYIDKNAVDIAHCAAFCNTVCQNLASNVWIRLLCTWMHLPSHASWKHPNLNASPLIANPLLVGQPLCENIPYKEQPFG